MAHGRRWLIGAAIVVAMAAALILIAAGGRPSLAEDGVIYVDVEAPGPTHDGASWETAFAELQPALDAAIAGDEIWVATGTYTPTWQFDPKDERSATFQMVNGVAIYGGFAGVETERGQRNWEANPTILSGDLNGDDGPDFANREDNGYHVFYHPDGTDLDDTAILDGFAITGGNANGLSSHNYGGGMYNDSSSPSLTNCAFRDNSTGYHGGGMYNDSSSPALTNCTFADNSANIGGGMVNTVGSSPTLTNCTFSGNSAGDGGGMTNYSSSSPALTNCTFSGNSASRGGGIHNDSSSPALADCTFEDNSADDGGGISNVQSSPTLTNCTFSGNTANQGGGMHNYDSSPELGNCTFIGNSAVDYAGGGIYNSSGSSPTLTGCTFEGNTAANCGGAMGNSTSSPTLINCTFQDNSAPVAGAMVNFTSAPTLTNCTFSGNSADHGAGGILNSRSSPTLVNCTFAGNSGEGMLNDEGSSPILSNCTFTGNSGGAMWNEDGSSPVLTNCILWGDTKPEIDGVASSPIVTYSDIEGGHEGEGNIDADPLFVNAAAGDLRLHNTSPAIDAGDNDAPGLDGVTTDKAGNARFVDVLSVPDVGNGEPPIIDMGAYEADPRVIFVDREASGANDGSSWDSAFAGLQAALEAATMGDQIWVAAGVYTPTWQFDAADPRSAAFQLLNGVTIYGGFDPSAGAVAFDDRNWVLHETILSGDLDGDDGLDFENTDENSYHVFYHPDGTGLDATAILDGFIISGGRADGAAWPHDAGGGMCNWYSSPTLNNCTFTGNSASYEAGGMLNYYSSPTLADCTFEDNSADEYGGGMVNVYYSPTLINCTFTGNSATLPGGGMANGESTPTLTGCTFTNNSSMDQGGGMYNWYSSPTLKDCTFTDNSAAGAGGGMGNTNGSLPTLTNCVFSGNTAGDEGGGMLNDSSSPTLTGCTFSGNTADAGGGIHNSNSSPTLTNVTFAGNEASSGGGMHNNESSPVLINCTFWGNSAQGHGGGMRNKSNSLPTLTNCTFHGNRATNGGAIQNYQASPPTLTNCILWGDSHPEIYNLDSAAPDVTFSDIQGSYLYPGTGNINEDPRFVDPDNGDFHLLPDSPCIDTGTGTAPFLPDKDFEGDPRSLDGDGDGTATADMGVDEALWLRGFMPLVLRE